MSNNKARKKAANNTPEWYSIFWSEEFEAPEGLIEYCKTNNLALTKNNNSGLFYFDHIKLNTEEHFFKINKFFSDLTDKVIYFNSLDYHNNYLWDIKVFIVDGDPHPIYESLRDDIEDANHREDNCYITWVEEKTETTDCIDPHLSKAIAYDVDTTIEKIWDRFSHKNAIIKNIQISKLGFINGYIERPGMHIYPDLNSRKTTKLSGIEVKKFDNWTLYKTIEKDAKVARELRKAFMDNCDDKEYTDACEEFKDYLYRTYDDVKM